MLVDMGTDKENNSLITNRNDHLSKEVIERVSDTDAERLQHAVDKCIAEDEKQRKKI